MPDVVKGNAPDGARDLEAVRDDPAGRAGRPARPPGRLGTDDEVAERLRRMQPVPGIAEDVAGILEAGARLGLTHDISDAEAARLAARHGARADDQRRQALAGAERGLLAGPAGRGQATLPALLGRGALAPVGAGRELARPDDGPVVPMWMTIYQAPSYLRQVIRALGTATFGVFPCFEEHRRAAGAAGEDPLGSIRCLASINGGPNRPEEVNQVAEWVARNGVVVDHMQMRFPEGLLPQRYQPRVILAAVDDVSYLLVEESVERGAHVDARYVYSWKGGMDFYLANPEAVGRIGGMAPRDRHGIAPVRVAAAPRVGQLPPVARALPAPSAMVGERLDMGARRKARRELVAKLPEAPPSVPSGSEAVRSLRAQGFLPFGTPSGPALRKVVDDGEIHVVAQPGHALANSPSLTVRVLDAAGATISEFPYDGEADLAAATARSPGAGP